MRTKPFVFIKQKVNPVALRYRSRQNGSTEPTSAFGVMLTFVQDVCAAGFVLGRCVMARSVSLHQGLFEYVLQAGHKIPSFCLRAGERVLLPQDRVF